MELVIDFLKGFNIQTIIAFFAISWGFHQSIVSRMERHESRTDRLYEMFIDLLKERNKSG